MFSRLAAVALALAMIGAPVVTTACEAACAADRPAPRMPETASITPAHRRAVE